MEIHLRRQAQRIVSDLPHDLSEARRVLEIARELLADDERAATEPSAFCDNWSAANGDERVARFRPPRTASRATRPSSGE